MEKKEQPAEQGPLTEEERRLYNSLEASAPVPKRPTELFKGLLRKRYLSTFKTDITGTVYYKKMMGNKME